jgi:regulator of protease activity HflC (stomatin/prohibitin superfamily)
VIDSALGWIGDIVRWCAQFIPRWHVLSPTVAAIKQIGWSFRRKKFPGVRRVVQREGIVFWWPATTELMLWPVARQANNLQSQTIVTTDGKTFIVGGLIVFEIEDVEKAVCETYDTDDTIRDLALAAIHDACIMYSAEELHAANRSGRLNTAMKREAHTRLQPFGVRVLAVRLTDLAPCRVYRLFGDSPLEKFQS